MNSSTPFRIKLLSRFDELVSEGEKILAAAEDVPATYRIDTFGEHRLRSRGYAKLDLDRFVEWRTKSTTLLAHIIPKEHVQYNLVQNVVKLQASKEQLQGAISALKGLKNDLETGFLDTIFTRIEAQVASDYMGQAERLLADGHPGKFDHVPAAVLAGAVLEKGLRTMCAQQQPPIDTVNPNGEPKTLNPLIDDLKKAGLYNELKAKQLRAWADIRNKAAHGDFDQFKRTDVEQMLQGITNFLADYFP
jgi:hypothetical protein